MAELKNDITREQLIILVAKHIKECSKKLSEDRPNIEVNVSHSNWVCGGKDKKWSHSRIYFGDKGYNFYDKEITDKDFLVMMETALKESNCKGRIDYDERTEWKGLYSVPQRIFRSITLIGKPCKEYVTLNRLLKKYTNKELGEMQVYYARVCGKRSSWSANMASADYLDFSKKKCQKAIDFIRSTRTSKDTLTFKVSEHLSHGDEEDYRIAQYQESEWYGSLCNNLELVVTTPKGKEKGTCKVYCQW